MPAAAKTKGLTQADVSAPAAEPAATKPDATTPDVSQETSAKPEQKAPDKPKAALRGAAANAAAGQLSDKALLAELEKRGLKPAAAPAPATVAGSGIATPMEIRKDLKWRSHKTSQHLFQIAARPEGGFFAKPESFLGDIIIVEDLSLIEEFDRWPNKYAPRR